MLNFRHGDLPEQTPYQASASEAHLSHKCSMHGHIRQNPFICNVT